MTSGRMTVLRWLFPISGLLVLRPPAYCSTALPQSSCAVRIELRDSGAGLLPSNWFPWTMELLDSSGKVVERRSVYKPQSELCDFPFGVHSVKISANGYLPLVVSDIKIVIGKPLHLVIVLVPSPYGDVFYSTCFAYVRVHDGQGRPVAGALIKHRDESTAVGTTDKYGRWQGGLPGHDVVVVAKGFEDFVSTYHCQSNEYHEVDVNLESNKK